MTSTPSYDDFCFGSCVLDDFAEDHIRPLHRLAKRDFHLLHGTAPSRDEWLRASLVLLDEAAVHLCLAHELPSRDDVILVMEPGADQKPWREAVRLGVERLVELPSSISYLRARMTDVLNERSPERQILTIVGAVVWPSTE